MKCPKCGKTKCTTLFSWLGSRYCSKCIVKTDTNYIAEVKE